MAAFIPSLVGLGTSLAGGIAGMVKSAGETDRLRGRGLASRALAERNARGLQAQTIAQRTNNPLAAVRTGAQLGTQARQEGNVAAAREQTVKNQLLSQMGRQDADALAGTLGNLGGGINAFGAQLTASEPDAAPELGAAPAAAPVAASQAEPLTQAAAPTVPLVPAIQQSGQLASVQQGAGPQTLGGTNASQDPVALLAGSNPAAGFPATATQPAAAPQAAAGVTPEIMQLLSQVLGGRL